MPFPAAWPYGYTPPGIVPGGGILLPSGAILWPIPGSNPPEYEEGPRKFDYINGRTRLNMEPPQVDFACEE